MKIRDYMNTSEERLWGWYKLGEEEEDRSRDQRTVSTEI